MAVVMFWFERGKMLASFDPTTKRIEVGHVVPVELASQAQPFEDLKSAMKRVSKVLGRKGRKQSKAQRAATAKVMRAMWAKRKAAKIERGAVKVRKGNYRKISAAQRAKMVAGIRRHWTAKRKAAK